MKKIILFFFLSILFSCKSETDKVVVDLGTALNGWDSKEKLMGADTINRNSADFYIKENVYVPKNKAPYEFEESIKGIVDKDLNSTPTSKSDNTSSPFFNGTIFDNYEWDLPTSHVILKCEYKENGKYTFRLWANKK